MTVNLSLLGGAAAQFFDSNGDPLSGGKLYTYAAGTTTPQATYTTSAGTIAHANPIVLDAAGRVPTGEIWLTDAVSYKFVVKTSADVTVGTYDDITGNASGILSAFTGPSGSASIGFIQAGANAVATTVQAKLRQTVSVKDFGAVGDGVTDDSAAIQAAMTYIQSAGGGTVLFPEPAVAYRITTPITVPSYTSIQGQSRDTKVFRDFVNGFAFLAPSTSYITIDRLWIYSTTPSVTSPSGAIGFQNGTYNRVNDVTVVGMRQYGIWMYDSSYNTVENCSFSGWIGSYQQDSCDICALNNANWNTIRNNKCFGGGDHGILVQDTYAGATPTGNIVTGNTVGEHTAYGIIVYVTNNYDTKTKVINNDVRDITGTSLSGASGAGIYIQSAGGAICEGNTVSNCCRSTTNFFTLAPAGIGISTPIGTFAVPTIVANNSVSSTRGPCIASITSGGPVLINGNTCSLTTTDATVNPSSIYISNSNRCTVSNNIVVHSAPNPAVYAVARSTATIVDTAIVSNSIRTNTSGIVFERLDTSTFEGARVTNNYVEGATVLGMRVLRTTNAVVSNNVISSSSVVFELNNSPRTQISNNVFVSTDATNPVVAFVGTNTGSLFSESNSVVGRFSNDASSGVIVSQYGNTAPVTGNLWNVGDRVIQSVPVAGQPKGWRCTVAGNPGTWVSEGNL